MKYSVFYETIKTEYATFKTAGIEAVDENGKVLCKIHDVSTDFSALNRLVLSLNSENVSLFELENIIEDYYLEHY